MRKSDIAIVLMFMSTLFLGVIWFFKAPPTSVRQLPALAYSLDTVPDFISIKDPKTKKKAFFDYLRPAIKAQNAYLTKTREYIESLQEKHASGALLSNFERSELTFLRQEYRVNTELNLEQTFAELLRKIDIIPAELVLIQSANESAWGTSRFAQQGYNFFGLWCFVKGCGFVPKQRIEGAQHEVAKFKNLDRAVYIYMRNLNRHYAYAELRKIRAGLRQNNQAIDAFAIVDGLGSYSERGESYIEELKDMMRTNKALMNL